MDIDRAIKKAIRINNEQYVRDTWSILTRKNGFLGAIEDLKKERVYKKGGKAMRKVASVPVEVDVFFTKVYGKDYYKDKDFFTKYYTEWNVYK